MARQDRADLAGKPLSANEVAVLEQLSNGATYTAIGRQLGISAAATRMRVARMHYKLGARNTPHAVRIGFERGYLRPAIGGA